MMKRKKKVVADVVMKVDLTFTEPVLGTAPANPAVYKEFIASKHPKGDAADEVEALTTGEEIERIGTVFPRTDGKLHLWDYQIRGFFKDACGALGRIKGGNKLTAYKKEIDGLVFVFPRRLFLKIPKGGGVSWLERPLRAQTAQGERIALARSEMVPVGTKVEFEVMVLDERLAPYVDYWLDYGRLRGLCQWRNASYGRFTWEGEEIKVKQRK